MQRWGTYRALSACVELNLDHTRLTDKGLELLRPLQNLERLEMFRTRASNAGMAAIASLKSLKMLGLDYTSVDDEGFAILKGLPALQELRLDSTGISDASIESLKSMHTLKVLNLYHTTVTEKGFEQLKAAFRIAGLFSTGIRPCLSGGKHSPCFDLHLHSCSQDFWPLRVQPTGSLQSGGSVKLDAAGRVIAVTFAPVGHRFRHDPAGPTAASGEPRSIDDQNHRPGLPATQVCSRDR